MIKVAQVITAALALLPAEAHPYKASALGDLMEGILLESLICSSFFSLNFLCKIKRSEEGPPCQCFLLCARGTLGMCALRCSMC